MFVAEINWGFVGGLLGVVGGIAGGIIGTASQISHSTPGEDRRLAVRHALAIWATVVLFGTAAAFELCISKHWAWLGWLILSTATVPFFIYSSKMAKQRNLLRKNADKIKNP